MEPAIAPPSLARNRVLDVLQLYAELEGDHRVANPAHQQNSPAALRLKLQQYENVRDGYRRMKGLNQEEKKTRRFVKYDIRRIKAKLKPTAWNRFRYSRPVAWLISYASGEQQNRAHHDKLLSDSEKTSTLEANTSALMSKLKSAGFGDHIQGTIKRMLEHNTQPGFSFPYYDIHKPDTDYVLHFKKIPSTDVYYFEKYEATERPDMHALLRKEKTGRSVSVSMMEPGALNAEEARKVAAGKAIEKKIAGESIWFTPAPAAASGIQRVHFNLQSAVESWPIVNLDQEGSRNALYRNLSMGREHDITLDLGNGRLQPAKVGTGSGPGGIRLNFRDVHGRPLNVDHLFRDEHALNRGAEVMTKIVEAQHHRQNAIQRLFKIR